MSPESQGAPSLRPPVVTAALLGLITVAFVLQVFAGALTSPAELFWLGANSPELVHQGQHFRLLSAAFLHGSLPHLLFDGLALWVWGSAVELLLGRGRLLVIYVAAAIGGNLASAMAARSILSVGASSALFGLLGALLVVEVRHRAPPPYGLQQGLRWWVLTIGVNAALPLLLPMIDGLAHAGGFATGMLCALLLTGQTPPPLGDRWYTWLLGGAATAATVASLAMAGYHAVEKPPEDLEGLASVARRPGATADQLNAFAWEVALLPEPPRSLLEAAQDAARRAVDDEPGRVEILDTLATVYFRLGSVDEAVAREREVLARAEKDKEQGPLVQTYASQLTRFLDRRLLVAGPSHRGGRGADGVELALDPAAGWKGEAVTIEVGAPFEQGVELYALAKDGGRRLGMLRICLGPRAAASLRLEPQRTGEIEGWPTSTRLDVALVDTSTTPCSGEEARVRVYVQDPDVDRYP